MVRKLFNRPDSPAFVHIHPREVSLFVNGRNLATVSCGVMTCTQARCFDEKEDIMEFFSELGLPFEIYTRCTQTGEAFNIHRWQYESPK